MFQELMPLLAQRVVMLTATRINSDLVCVNIIPQRLKSGDENNEALTIPLSLTGTPKELDEELPKQFEPDLCSRISNCPAPSRARKRRWKRRLRLRGRHRGSLRRQKLEHPQKTPPKRQRIPHSERYTGTGAEVDRCLR